MKHNVMATSGIRSVRAAMAALLQYGRTQFILAPAEMSFPAGQTRSHNQMRHVAKTGSFLVTRGGKYTIYLVLTKCQRLFHSDFDMCCYLNGNMEQKLPSGGHSLDHCFALHLIQYIVTD